MKKFFTLFVGIAVGLGAYAQDFDSGGLKYSVLSQEKKTCMVTGYEYLDQEQLIIPERVDFDGEEYTVIEIGENAFRGNNFANLILPSTLEVIGANAFWNCYGISSLVIPNSVKEIQRCSFQDCNALRRLELGSSIEIIDESAFRDCPIVAIFATGEKPAKFENGYLNSIPSNPQVAVSEELIPEYKAAWEGATIIPYIPAESLSFDPRNYVVQPGGSIQLKYVVTPENATVLFYTWYSDIDVDNNGLVTADKLKGGYWVDVTATSLNGLTATCFIEITQLESFDVDGFKYSIIPDAENEVAVMSYSEGNTVVDIPESVEHNGILYSVTTIAPSALFRRSDIEEVIIPASVKLIREDNFNYCSALKKVTIADSETPIELSNNNFTDNSNFTDLYVGRNLNYSDNSYCFLWNDKLAHIVLGAEVTSLPDNVFSHCYNLKLIESLNPNPPAIGNRVFGYNDLSIIVPAESVEAYKKSWEQYADYISVAVNADKLLFETEEITLYNGQRLQLPVTVEPENAIITYTSSNPNLVSVDKEGYIDYYSWRSDVGEAIITASSLNGLTAECKVNAKHWLTFSKDNLSLTPNETYQVEVTKPDVLAESTVTWTTDNPDVAIVDENGVITAVGCGDTDVYAWVYVPDMGEFSYNIEIEVRNLPTKVTAENPVVSVWKDESTSINLIFEPQDDYNLNREMTWTVADPGIAEVFTTYENSYGVRGLNIGSTTITGETVNGLKVEIEVVVKTNVEYIIFPSDKLTIASGESCELKFTTIPEVTNQTFRFTSDNEDIVTVDENGVVTAHNYGSTYIGVWADTPWGYSPVGWQRIEVVQMPESVRLVGSTDYEGSLMYWKEFNIEFTPDNEYVCKDIEWTIEDPSIVEINSSNWFIGLKLGSTTFKGIAFNGDVLEGTITIPGIQLYVDGEATQNKAVNLGSEIKINVDASSPEMLDNVTFISENPEIVTVTEDGTVTAIGCGIARVVAETWIQVNEYENRYYSNYIEFTVRPESGIMFNINECSLTSNNWWGYLTIIRAEGEENGNITWESSDNNVVTFSWSSSNEAEIRYVGPGQATVTATDENGNVASCLVNCYGIVFTPSEVNMLTNSTFRLEAKLLPENTESPQINLISSNEDIVSVGENWVLTSSDATGSATIFASTWINGYYIWAGCDVTVAEFVPVTQITLNETVLAAVEGSEVQLVATVYPEDATNKELRWESSNNYIATVDQTGLVKILSVGTAVIRAMATDGSEVYATCIISGTTGVDSILADGESFDIYNMNGFLIKKDATADDFMQLVKGIYLLRRGDTVVKIKR